MSTSLQVSILQELCVFADREPPRLVIFKINTPLAGVFLLSSKGVIILSRGLLNRLNEREQKAVIAHELAHLVEKHGLLRLFTLGAIGALISYGYILTTIIKVPYFITPGIIMSFLSIAEINREQEHIADEKAVEWTKDPHALISAIQKTQSSGKYSILSSVFSGHPSPAARSKRILRPIKD